MTHNIDFESSDFNLWMRRKYTNYIVIFILFFGLGYIFDFLFLSISLITIISLLLLKNTKVNKYIINQPLLLWLAIFIPYTIIFTEVTHYDIFFPFSWLFISDSGYRDYGIYKFFQNQTDRKFFIVTSLVVYIGGVLDIKYYDKFKSKFDYITPRFKKIYICLELLKKTPEKEDVLHTLVYQRDTEKVFDFLNTGIKGVSKLRIRKSEIERKDQYGRPPIHLATTVEMVKLFLQKGVEIDQENIYSGQTLLHLASRRGDLKIAEFLLDKGADINKKDIRKRTPLDYAKNTEMRSFLIKKGGRETVLYNKVKYYFLSKKS